MENRIFRKSISFDHVFYGFDPKIGLHFYFHFKPFSDLDVQIERERERERAQAQTHGRWCPEPILADDAQKPRTHPHRWCPKPPLDTRPHRRMQATPPTHPLSLSSDDPSLILIDPSLILVLTDPPPLTHPSFELIHTFKSSFTDWKVTAKHRSEPYHLILVAAKARRQRQTQIGALTWFQSLTLSSSPFLFDRVWKLMVLFWFSFL